MAIIRLSGTVLGADDPNRSSRAKLLYLLFADGWDIYNANGDQRITLQSNDGRTWTNYLRTKK